MHIQLQVVLQDEESVARAHPDINCNASHATDTHRFQCSTEPFGGSIAEDALRVDLTSSFVASVLVLFIPTCVSIAIVKELGWIVHEVNIQK